MNMAEAARRLGVAEHEIVDLKAHAGWWHVLHHDMASHEESWKPVPVAADDPAVPAAEDAPAAEPVDDDPDGPGVDTDGDGVPDGSARQILAWVDGDHDRAALALAAEQGREAPRSTLVAALEKLVG